MGTRQRLYDSYLSPFLELTEEKCEHQLLKMYRDHLRSMEIPPEHTDEGCFFKKVCNEESDWTSIRDVINEMIHTEKVSRGSILFQNKFWNWLSPYVETGSVVRYVTENGEGYGWRFTEDGVCPIKGEIRWEEESHGYGRDITHELPESYNLEYPYDHIPRLVKR